MNPRSFCKSPRHAKALFLTYAFDPLFFENIVVPELRAGGCGEIVVLGDAHQVADAIDRCRAPLTQLGRGYLLGRANHIGAFHPKVFLRLGVQGGSVLVGSGNVTSAGWGGNQELGVSWAVGPDEMDTGAWIPSFLDSVSAWCRSDLERDVIRRMRDMPWLAVDGRLSTNTALLYSEPDSPIGPQLASRWAGRRFETLQILTGSTDEAGQMLRWAHQVFGVQRATICVTPARASFNFERLKALPLEVSVVIAPPHKPLHAKAYWFDGPDGAAATMGSANCSAAAWLLSPRNGGNIESMVVYDSPQPMEFQALLTPFEGAPLASPSTFSRIDVVPEIAQVTPAYELIGLGWDSETQTIAVELHPAPEAAAEVTLELAGMSVSLSATTNPRRWKADLTEIPQNRTLFGSVRISARGQEWITRRRWLDDLSKLDAVSRDSHLPDPFRRLGRPANASEQRRISEDLETVMRAIFDDATTAADWSTSGRERRGTEDQEWARTDPNDLIRDLRSSGSEPRLLDSPGNAVSIAGILQALFRNTDAVEDDESLDDDEAAKGTKKPRKPPATDSSDGSRTEQRFRLRVEKLMETLLVRLKSDAFASSCTATQMTQAVGFALVVSIRGKAQGWVSQATSEQWISDVVATLFLKSGADDGRLFDAVQQRYEAKRQSDVFHDVVGGGELWVSLIAAASHSTWSGVGRYVDKALVLRQIFSSEALVSRASSRRIESLVGHIHLEQARASLAKLAPTATQLLQELEASLAPRWQAVASDQTQRNVPFEIGDVLWRPGGWAVALEATGASNIEARLEGSRKRVRRSCFANVSALARSEPDLQARLTAIQLLGLPDQPGAINVSATLPLTVPRATPAVIA